MLVIDLVVGRLLDHIAEIRLLEYENTMRFQELGDAFGHITEIGDMAHDVGGEDGVGLAMFGRDLAGRGFAKETDETLDAVTLSLAIWAFATGRLRSFFR